MDKLKNIIKSELNLELLPLEVADLPGTLLAALCCGEGGIGALILVKAKYESEYDYIFAIAHEMRHYWQIVNRLIELDTCGGSGGSKDAYNLQPEELDAQAFGAFVMQKYFGVKPLFKGLDGKTKKAIFDYAAKTFI